MIYHIRIVYATYSMYYTQLHNIYECIQFIFIDYSLYIVFIIISNYNVSYTHALTWELLKA